MARRSVIFISIVAFLNLTTGCTASSPTAVRERGITVPADSVATHPTKVILRSILLDGTVLVYNHDGGRYKDRFRGQDSVIIGVTEPGELVITPISGVDYVKVEGMEPMKGEPRPLTFLEWTGIAVGFIFAAATIWLSTRLNPN